MKKWNNPELKMLGVENTKDDEHFCHRLGITSCTPNTTGNHNESENNSSGIKEHFWSGKECTIDHKKLGESTSNGNSKCCCLGVS